MMDPIDVNIPLPDYKDALFRKVDRDAETERLRLITPGFGKALSYQEKLSEARLVLDDPADIDLSLVPIIAGEAVARGISIVDCATLIHQTYLTYKTVEAGINAASTTAKLGIRDASDPAQAWAAYEAITWPSIP